MNGLKITKNCLSGKKLITQYFVLDGEKMRNKGSIGLFKTLGELGGGKMGILKLEEGLMSQILRVWEKGPLFRRLEGKREMFWYSKSLLKREKCEFLDIDCYEIGLFFMCKII